MITLEPLTPGEAKTWIEQSLIGFAEDLAKTRNLGSGEALVEAKSMLREILPQGELTSGHEFRWITHAGNRVGRIWFGPTPGDETTLYIWDILVDNDQQGLGYGGATLDLVAGLARQRQLFAVALTVFDTNPEARRLYESKGYVVLSSDGGQVLMRLDLTE